MKVSVDGQCLSAAQVPAFSRRLAWQIIAAFSHGSAGVDMEALVFDPCAADTLSDARIRNRLLAPPPSEGGALAPNYTARVNMAFRQAWLDDPPDVILLLEPLAREIAFLEPFGGIPIIACLSSLPVEGMDSARPLACALERIEKLKRAGAKFLVTSLALRDWLALRAGVAAERIETISPPLNHRRFCPRDEPPAEDAEAAFVLTLACDETAGELAPIFQAMARLNPRLGETRLAVAADPAAPRFRRSIARLAEREGLAPERWLFADDDDATLAELMRRAAGFLYFAREDHVGAPLLQAMACGCPSICSNSGILPELAGTAAMTATTPIEGDELRDRIARLIERPAERQAWSEKGVARAQKYGARQTAGKLLQVFHKENRPEAPVSGDLRIAYVSPFPPQATGIAEYSRRMAAELREYADLDLYCSSEAEIDPLMRTRFQIFPAADLAARFDKYDLAIYNMGDNYAQHREIFGLLSRYPGIVILHHVNLREFFLSARAEAPPAKRGAPGDGDPFVEEMAFCYGQPGREEALDILAGRAQPAADRLFLNRRIARRARGVVVHSRWAAEKILENGEGAIVEVLPHGAKLDPRVDREVWREFRESIQAQRNRFVIAAAGFARFPQRLELLFQAASRIRQEGIDAFVAIIGAQEPETEKRLKKLAERLGLGAAVRSLGFIVPHDAFLSHLAAADVVVNLRRPAAGEGMEIVHAALGLRKPLIVSAEPSFSFLPPGAAFQLRADDLELEMLTRMLGALARSPELRKAMGEAARRYVEDVADWSRVAHRFAQFLYNAARRRCHVPAD